jgi:hypothetical protein
VADATPHREPREGAPARPRGGRGGPAPVRHLVRPRAAVAVRPRPRGRPRAVLGLRPPRKDAILREMCAKFAAAKDVRSGLWVEAADLGRRHCGPARQVPVCVRGALARAAVVPQVRAALDGRSEARALRGRPRVHRARLPQRADPEPDARPDRARDAPAPTLSASGDCATRSRTRCCSRRARTMGNRRSSRASKTSSTFRRRSCARRRCSRGAPSPSGPTTTSATASATSATSSWSRSRSCASTSAAE